MVDSSRRLLRARHVTANWQQVLRSTKGIPVLPLATNPQPQYSIMPAFSLSLSHLGVDLLFVGFAICWFHVRLYRKNLQEMTLCMYLLIFFASTFRRNSSSQKEHWSLGAPYEQAKTVSRTFSFLRRYSIAKFENLVST